MKQPKPKLGYTMAYIRLKIAFKIAKFQQFIGCHIKLYNWFIPPFFGSLLWWLNRLIDPTSSKDHKELNWTTLEAIRVRLKMSEDAFWKMLGD